MSKPEDGAPQAEPEGNEPKNEPPLETWNDMKIKGNKPITVIRVVGNHRYELVYNEINGDEYEECVLDARLYAVVHDEYSDKRFNKKLSQSVRERAILKVGGADYDIKMDRDQPAWLRKDIEEFGKDLILGKL